MSSNAEESDLAASASCSDIAVDSLGIGSERVELATLIEERFVMLRELIERRGNRQEVRPSG